MFNYFDIENDIEMDCEKNYIIYLLVNICILFFCVIVVFGGNDWNDVLIKLVKFCFGYEEREIFYRNGICMVVMFEVLDIVYVLFEGI